MASELHDQQTELGVKWLRRQGFSVIATELNAIGCAEQADVVGFRSTCSVVIESKISRADFFADAKKAHRKSGGLGLYRFYICPPDVIQTEELPDKWGLLYAIGKQIIEVVRPKGNLWVDHKTSWPEWDRFKHEPDLDAERQVLFSISRRLAAGKPILKT